MREFKSGLPWHIRAGGASALRSAMQDFCDVFADSTVTEFRIISSRTVYTEFHRLCMRSMGDLSVFELFLWLLDRRHFIMWQYDAQTQSDPDIAGRFRSSYERLWSHATRMARSNNRQLRPPEWPSRIRLEHGKYHPALLNRPVRVVDERLMRTASAQYNGFWGTGDGPLDLYRASQDILDSHRRYSEPPASFEWMYESIAGPTLVADPPTFPYRPKGVHTW